MSRVITFSQQFPSTHPRAGKPTDFLAKIWKGLGISAEYCIYKRHPYQMKNGRWRIPIEWRDKMLDKDFKPKLHTIRRGKRWKSGMKFSPRVWSGKPYQSKQLIIAPDITIVKTLDFDMDLNCVFSINGKYIDDKTYPILAENDGLTQNDMMYWFMPNFNKPKEFSGQILCFTDKVNY